MMSIWPSPPDLDSLKELFATADIEGLIADECPLDEYDPEAKHFYEATIGYPSSKFGAEQTLPLLEQLWVKQFMLNEEQLAQRRSALMELARQIARFFGPGAQPQTRQQESRVSDYRPELEIYIEANANPHHKFGHQPRLYALTKQIGQGLTYDDDVVFAAIWLHDLGVFIGHRPEDEDTLKTWNHVAYITEKAPAILTEVGFPTEKIPAVIEVIRTHQPQDTPITLEAKIARDADILEQLGAIGITRTLAKLGSDTRFLTFTDALHALKKQLETLPAKLLLEASKVLVAPRVELMRSFIQSLESEGGQHLY